MPNLLTVEPILITSWKSSPVGRTSYTLSEELRVIRDLIHPELTQ